MARTSLWWVLLIIILSIAGCTVPPRPEPRPVPIQRPLVDGRCPRDGIEPMRPIDEGDPYLGSLPPEGFRPDTVVRCTVSPGRHQNGYELIDVTESSAAVTPELLTALALPDEVPERADFGCPENLEPTLHLLLVDATGRGYRPRIPVTPCHRPLAEVRRAIEALPWRVTAKFTIKQRS
ncbi:hypothetical protein [Microlunatus sp. GCM10028923]|uniref:hypothetical protein n=1 Tax=Microlunatus sp. GCM10028923 TaxID=3273400 RepID=UPI00361FB6EA